jgi:hypothetical protein
VLVASDGRSAGASSILAPVPRLAITEIVAFRTNLLSRLVRFHTAFEYLAVDPPILAGCHLLRLDQLDRFESDELICAYQ